MWLLMEECTIREFTWETITSRDIWEMWARYVEQMSPEEALA